MSRYQESAAAPSARMTPPVGIARKTQRVVGLALVLMLAALFLPLQAILLAGFSQLEARSVARNVERTLNAVGDERQELLQLVRDYTAWDDTYAFAKGQNPAYIEQNYNESTFETNQLNLVVLLDTAGEVLAYETYQIEAARGAATDDEVLRRVLASPLIDGMDPDEGATALILLPGEPMLLSAHPILKSDYTGPSGGTMIMGRTFDAGRVAEVGSRLRLDIQAHRLDQPDLAEDVAGAASELSQGATSTIRPLDADLVAGYGLIADAAGKPCLVLQVNQAREVMEIGRTTALYTLGAFVAAALFSTFSLTMLLNGLVLARLGRLIEGVRAIGAERDLGRRVALDGDDELSLLSNTIDQTMGALAQAERERRDAEARRQQMWQDVIESRRNFLATISHELRTPLTPIRGYADLMLHGIGGQITPEQQHYLQVIHQNSRRMESMVNDLLIMGQLDAGRIELRIEPVAVATAIQSVLTMLEQQIVQQGVSVSSQIPADLPPVRADPHRLDQILTNLITNAVKYTRPGGHVQISAERVAGDMVEVTVQDTGIGMSETEMERLFTPFYRANNVVSEQISGTGLGLSITRSLVEQHGGTVSVQSAPGVGSVFRFTLPAHVAEAATLAQASAAAE